MIFFGLIGKGAKGAVLHRFAGGRVEGVEMDIYEIEKVTDAEIIRSGMLTEFELRRRFIEATQTLFPVGDTGEVGGISEAIDILLHGVAGEEL